MQSELSAHSNNLQEYSYPGILPRIKALGIDYSILLLVFVVSYNVFDIFQNAPGYLRGAILIFMFCLYEPLMVSFLGGTIGHFMMKLRVRDNGDHSKKILLPLAFFRFLIKAFLGWISFFSIGFDERRRAIHDYAGMSVVIEVE